MNLEIKPYCEQVERWPSSGRHILAQFDDETIIVYGEDTHPPFPGINWLLEAGATEGHKREPVLRLNNIYGILRAVEKGETIEIVRRKTRVAHLTPIPQASEGFTGWANHAERMDAIWGDTMVRNVDETLDDLRGGR